MVLGDTDDTGCKTGTVGADTFPPTDWTVWTGTTRGWVEDKNIRIVSARDYNPCSSVTV